MKKSLIKIIGVVVFTLFCGGLFTNNSIDVVAKNKVIQLTDTSDVTTAKEENDKKIADLEAKKKDLEAKEIDLKVQKNEEFKNNGFSKRYYELSNELDDISDEIWDLEREIDKLENKTFEDVTDDVEGTIDNSVNIIDDFNRDVEEEKNSVFEFSKFMFIVPIVIFVIAFIIIVTIAIKSTKHMGSMMTGMSTKDMLNDLSDVAVKMAKDLNPTYKEFKCPNCGAALDPENTDIKKCNYCGAKLYKTVNTHNHSHKK